MHLPRQSRILISVSGFPQLKSWGRNQGQGRGGGLSGQGALRGMPDRRCPPIEYRAMGMRWESSETFCQQGCGSKRQGFNEGPGSGAAGGGEMLRQRGNRPQQRRLSVRPSAGYGGEMRCRQPGPMRWVGGDNLHSGLRTWGTQTSFVGLRWGLSGRCEAPRRYPQHGS